MAWIFCSQPVALTLNEATSRDLEYRCSCEKISRCSLFLPDVDNGCFLSVSLFLSIPAEPTPFLLFYASWDVLLAPAAANHLLLSSEMALPHRLIFFRAQRHPHTSPRTCRQRASPNHREIARHCVLESPCRQSHRDVAWVSSWPH